MVEKKSFKKINYQKKNTNGCKSGGKKGKPKTSDWS